MSTKMITPLTEQQVIGTLYHNIDLLDVEYSQYFISDIGNALFKGLMTLQEKNLNVSARPLLLNSLKHFSSLKGEHLDFLKDNPDENYRAEDLHEYIKELKCYKITHDLQNTKLDDFTIEISKKQLNYDNVELKLEEMLNNVRSLKKGEFDEEDVEFLSRSDEAKKFKEIIEKRKEGIRYPSGDTYLDKYLYNQSLMPQELSVIFGNPGSGKSTVLRNLEERRILKQLPTLSIKLEMSTESELDSRMSLRTNLLRTDFSINPHNDDEETGLDNKYDRIEKAIDLEMKRAKRYNYYYHLNLDTLNFKQLRRYVLKAKKMMGLKEDDYLFVSIDLMSQMREFNEGINGKASAYEDAMNEAHAFVKETNIHLLGVFQPKRVNDKVSINTIEDTYKLKPNTESLKNSGAIEERSRVIISVFRPYYTLAKYNPDAPELEYLDDVAEVNIIKQNNLGVSPTLYYKFHAEKGALYAYPDYDPNLAYDLEEEEKE